MITRVFVVLVVLALAGVFSLPMMFKNGSGLPWSLKVNGQPVSKTKFLLTVQDQRERLAFLRAQYGQYFDMLQMMGMNLQPESLAIEQLSQQILLQQLAQEMNLLVDPAYALEKIQDQAFATRYLSDVMPAFLFDSNGEIVQDRLKSYLQRKNITSDKLVEEAQAALQRMIVASVVEQLAYVPSFEQELAYQSQNARRKFSIATFAYSTYLQKAKALDISDEKLREFFAEQNASYNRYFSPEERIGTRWKFTDKSYNIAINETEIENFYQAHKNIRYVQQPARVQVRIITYYDDQENSDRKPLYELKEDLMQNPERFADYAKKYSDDEKSSQKGGLLEPFERGSIADKTMEKAAFTLAQEGDISDLVPVHGGKAIVQLVKKHPRSYIPLSEVSQKIRKKLQKEAFKKQLSADVAQLRGESSHDKIAAFCKKHGAIKEVITATSPEGDSDNQTEKALFAIKQEGGFETYTQGLVGYLLVLDTITKKQAKSFETVKNQVQNDYIDYQAHELLSKDLEQAKKDLQTESFATVANTYKAKTETTDWITPADQQQAKNLQKRGLPVAQMFQIETKTATLAHKSDKNGYLVMLDELAPVDADDVTKKQEFTAQHSQELKSRLVESVIASLHRDATIEINETAEILNENYYL